MSLQTGGRTLEGGAKVLERDCGGYWGVSFLKPH